MPLRWLNLAALGDWRTSCSGSVPIEYFIWYFLRMSPQDDCFDDWLPVARVQRRLIHQVSQRIDEGLVQNQALSQRIRLENAASEENIKVRSMQVKAELLHRFLARNSGFVGTQNGANQDMVDAGLVEDTGKSNKGPVAAAHFAAVYWARASEQTKAMMRSMAQKYLSSFAFPSLAVYHDASDVCSKEVTWIKFIIIILCFAMLYSKYFSLIQANNSTI